MEWPISWNDVKNEIENRDPLIINMTELGIPGDVITSGTPLTIDNDMREKLLTATNNRAPIVLYFNPSHGIHQWLRFDIIAYIEGSRASYVGIGADGIIGIKVDYLDNTIVCQSIFADFA